MDSGLIGREREQRELVQARADAGSGHGQIVLLAGEAGVGKTRLAHESLAGSEILALTSSGEPGTAPYGPITTILRAYLRAVPSGLNDCGPLTRHLSYLLPELGPLPAGTGRSTIFEAVRCAFETIASHGPAVVFLDDLHWADNTTLEFLPVLAGALERTPLLILGAYRSDEITRGHPLRRMRTELRRMGRLRELAVEPLTQPETAALTERILRAPIDSRLASILYDRTQGVTFFVEELAKALLASGRLQRGNALALVADEDVPVPDTVRDAVLLRVDTVSGRARRALEVAAVAGSPFELDLVSELIDETVGIDEAIESGLLVELDSGKASFRHALTREVIYSDIPWTRKRALHRELAVRLEARGAAPGAIAGHWLSARDDERSRLALMASADASAAVYAYRDALGAGWQALGRWTDGGDERERLDLLMRLGAWAQLCGELSEALRAWRQAGDGYRVAGDLASAAQVDRRLAAIYEIQGSWEAAMETRQVAAGTFASAGMPADAAAERLVVAAHLRSAACFQAALTILDDATREAEGAGRVDLQARILALRGNILARLGRGEDGLIAVRAGLDLALGHRQTVAAAEIYQRLGDSLEHTGDYSGARAVYGTAAEYCESQGAGATAQLCLACLTVVLRWNGEWERATALSRAVLVSPESTQHARAVANGMLGVLHVLRGEPRRARPLLLQASIIAKKIELAAIEFECCWGLAMLDDLAGSPESALVRCKTLLQVWERTDERHYVVPSLYWMATFCAEHHALDELGACCSGSSRIAAATGQPEALAGLAHALGEIALSERKPLAAVDQFDRAVDLLHDRTLPFERAQSMWRAGTALLQAGERGVGVDRLVSAYRAAERLGARPLAERIASELSTQGEPVEKRLGRRAAGRLQHAGLTRREMEVLQRVATGYTNREIAHELFLSARTIDMHVSNILIKLDCRSRADASRRASELGLVGRPTNLA